MANYVITDYVTDPKLTVGDVTALIETYLETKDSTSNPLVKVDIVRHGTMFVGVVVHQGA